MHFLLSIRKIHFSCSEILVNLEPLSGKLFFLPLPHGYYPPPLKKKEEKGKAGGEQGSREEGKMG